MSKEQKKLHYSGTLVSLAQDVYDECDNIVALRLHKIGRSYPMPWERKSCGQEN